MKKLTNIRTQKKKKMAAVMQKPIPLRLLWIITVEIELLISREIGWAAGQLNTHTNTHAHGWQSLLRLTLAWVCCAHRRQTRSASGREHVRFAGLGLELNCWVRRLLEKDLITIGISCCAALLIMLF